MNFKPYFNNLERVGTVQKTIPGELEFYGFFKKSKARVAKMDALNPEPVSGNHFDDGFQSSCVRQIERRNIRHRWRALFETTSSYGRSFIEGE